jgi:hypothetical protein
LHVPVHPGAHAYRPQPVVFLDLDWPWERRQQRRWSPRYAYEQTVYVRDGYRDARLEIVTEYRQRVLRAAGRRADVELDIKAFELYQNGRYLGRVDRLPAQLARVRAQVDRRGRVRVDRDVLLVGSRRAGFELLVTRGRGDWHDAYYGRDGVRVARVDLRRGRVHEARGSRLLGWGRQRLVPVSLLPDDPSWLLDYGAYAPSAFPYDRHRYDDFGFDDGFFYGSHGQDHRYFGSAHHSRTTRGDDDDRWDDDDDDRWEDDDRDERRRSAPQRQGRAELPSLAQERVETVTLPGGETVELRRDVRIRRIE